MRGMITAAVAATALATAGSALALTSQPYASPAGMEAAHHFASEAALSGGSAGLQENMVGRGLRTDGQSDFSGDGAVSYGYLTSAEPKGPAKAEPAFENDLPNYRVAGVTTHYATTAPAK